MIRFSILEAALSEHAKRYNLPKPHQAKFCEFLSGFPEAQGKLAASSFSKYAKDNLSRPMRMRFDAACGAALKLWELTEDELKHRNPPVPEEKPEPTLPEIPASLSGAWFLVQYRASRAIVTDDIPNLDIRVAVLVYGGGKKSLRHFEIIGGTTHWRGKVVIRDRHFVVDAEQIDELLARETLSMILHPPHEAGRKPQHGVMIGSVHSELDSVDKPVYASRVLLVPVTGKDGEHRGPLSNEVIKTLRLHCCYVRPEEIVAPDDNDTSLGAQRMRAVAAFHDRADIPNNQGNRLLVRR